MHIRDCDFQLKMTGEGMPLLWAHAMDSCMREEDAQGGPWTGAPEGVRLVRYDARGHGGKGHGGRDHGGDAADYCWDGLARDMLALADALAPGPRLLGGVSMGCATALCAALMAPAQVRGLILVLPPTIWEGRAAHARLYRRAARLTAADPIALRLGGAALSDLPPPAAFAVLAQVPVLLIARENDARHPVLSAERLQALLPRSELIVDTHGSGWALDTAGTARMAAFATGCAHGAKGSDELATAI